MAEIRLIRMLSAVWGMAGVMALLGSAIYRMTPLAVDALAYNLSWYHWAFLAITLAFMGYFEGYRAFQLAFSPRVAARARYLLTHNNTLHAVFAPLFCMAYFHAPKRRRLVSISVTAGIIVLIVLIRLLPQPWRGIIDAGVVLGLSWGLITLVIFSIQAFTSRTFCFSPEVPQHDPLS